MSRPFGRIAEAMLANAATGSSKNMVPRGANGNVLGVGEDNETVALRSRDDVALCAKAGSRPAAHSA